MPVDENEIRARVSEASAVEADFAILRARIHEQVYQVLTPEQQAKAKTLQAERQKRRSERAEQFKQRREQSAAEAVTEVLGAEVPGPKCGPKCGSSAGSEVPVPKCRVLNAGCGCRVRVRAAAAHRLETFQ